MTKPIQMSRSTRLFPLVELTAYVAGIAAAVVSLTLIAGENIDVATAYLILLAVAPLGLCQWFPRTSAGRQRRRWFSRSFGSESKPTPESAGWAGRLPWILAAIVGTTSLCVSAGIGKQFGDLPPAFHDEYSYLFQAKTFLAGRLSYPSHPAAPRLFDQMHVLNEGRFVSRYFPGTGMWIAPFLALGHPYLGHWLAGTIAAMLIFWTGRELGGNGVGLLAGMATALSPGMGLFSNLLVSHHPTLVGLTLFLLAFLRMVRRRCPGYAALAGIGLSYAMLCRPLTAAGVGFPFGVWLLWLVCHTGESALGANWKQRFGFLAAMGAPILAGLLIVAGYNRATTGDVWTTPYQVYTDTYTPRHVYGFNNVVRGESRLGPKVIENYDRWAENLTPRMAANNVLTRLLVSWQWTLGIVPLAMAAVVFLSSGCLRTASWGVIFAAIVTLHAVHVPYWYAGIMGWHYVFESGPLWALVFAGTTAGLLSGWRLSARPLMPIWWFVVVGLAYYAIYVPIPTQREPRRTESQERGTAFSPSRIQLGIGEIAFARRKYADFRRAIERGVTIRPALVLIEADPSDRHIDFVVNDPSLDTDVLFGRYDPAKITDARIRSLFPDRACYRYRASKRELELLP